MLVEIDAECPECGAVGPIRVSSDVDGFTATSCGSCGARLITQTGADGHVVVQGDERQTLVFLPGRDQAAFGGDGQTVVLPPERFGLRNAAYGTEPDFGGLSDEEFAELMGSGVVQTTPHLLFNTDGSLRPERDIVAHLGWRGLWSTQLSAEVERRLVGPPPMVLPAKVFLSYRWQAEAENDWVAELAAELRTRGYGVMFDRDLPQTDTPNVPQIVSRVAECRYFVAIVDPGYLERIGDGEQMQDGWVFDEFNTAARLAEAGLVRMLGFWRRGPGVSQQFQLAEPGRMGNMVDVRTPAKLRTMLDQVFPSLPDGDHDGARAAMLRAHEAFVDGDVVTAVAEARTMATLVPASPDGWLELIRIAHLRGDPELGFEAAMAVVDLVPDNVELLIEAGSFAVATGRPDQAAMLAARALDQRNDDTAQAAEAHAAMAWALDEFDRVDTALGHARTAAALNPDHPLFVNNLGYILRRVGDPVGAAEVLSDGLQRFPDDLMLLENYASAATEAGIWDAAEALVRHLHQRGGREAVVGALARAVLAGQESGERSRFVAEPDLPPISKLLACDTCETRVIMGPEDTKFCAACGTPAESADRLCRLCAHDGWMVPLPAEIPATVRCPLCRNGAFALLS